MNFDKKKEKSSRSRAPFGAWASFRRGFTLVELLLGLSIFALIAASISSTLWVGIKLSHRMAPQNDIYSEARRSLDLMAKELENALFYDFANSYPNKSAFIGESSKITFLLGGDDGLKAVSYYLAEPQRSRIHKVVVGKSYSKNVTVTTKESRADPVNYLVREEIPFVDYLSDSKENARIEVINIHTRENGLRFFYQYAEGKENDTYSWEPSWPEGYIPSGMRIEIDVLSQENNHVSVKFSRDIFVPSGTLGKEEPLGGAV